MKKINCTHDNLDALSVELAQTLNWSGDLVMHVMLQALTDSNFHELRGRVEALYLQYLKESE
jgi:hypothetical protein